jgi:hypothetical protein
LREHINLLRLAFNTIGGGIIFAMIVARGIVLKLTTLVIIVDGGQEHLIYLDLKIIIK